MLTTILVLTLFNFLATTLGIVILTYQFFVKYIQPKLELKKVEREKLLEEYKNKKENSTKLISIETNQVKEDSKDNV